MNYAYDEMYVSLAQRNLGDAFDYAVNTLNYSLDEFYKMFLVSNMARHFEIGNPTYVAGKNGCEIAKIVLKTCGDDQDDKEDVMYVDKSPEYWIGWALAYYQWISNISYKAIGEVVSIDEIYGMYATLHEADISVFVDVMNKKMSGYKQESALRRYRAYAKLSQSELATKADVSIRQIQLFEQGQRDINKAQVQTIKSLSEALNCSVEDIIQ